MGVCGVCACEDRVSVWVDAKVLELQSADGCSTL